MALTREAQQERAAVIKYLRSKMTGDVRTDQILAETITSIRNGDHVRAVRRG